MPESQIHVPLRRTTSARFTARAVLALTGVSVLALIAPIAIGACASAPPPRTDVVRQLSPSEEADMIEAAKRHPIATTYERPRSGDLPVAPPPVPAEAPPPPPQPTEAQAAPAPRDQVVIVGNEPAPPAPPTTNYRWPETSDPDYVDSPYAWVDGAWVARPGYRAYVDTPWVGVGVGVGVGRPWGYGWGYGYNSAYPRSWGGYPYYRRPPVIVVPSRPLPPPRARYYGGYGYDRPSMHSPRYQSSPRREVYVAPRAPSRAPSVAPRPTYRAPAASPRNSGSVHRAPAAAPRSSGSGGGGRRSVHVR